MKELKIDALTIHGAISFPRYCRNNADRVRWLALKGGFVDTIRPEDRVSYCLETNSYRLIRIEQGYSND